MCRCSNGFKKRRSSRALSVISRLNTTSPICCKRTQCVHRPLRLYLLCDLKPNARRQARRAAEARDERTLAAVACTPLLGTEAGTGLRLAAPSRPPSSHNAPPDHVPTLLEYPTSPDTHPTPRCRGPRLAATRPPRPTLYVPSGPNARRDRPLAP